MMPVENLPKTLPDMETAFEIDVEGNMTKKRYTGSFTFRIPNMRTRAAADKERARLNEVAAERLDPTVQDFHQMISYLRVTLSQAPEWWKASHEGYDLYDANVVTQVYIKVMQFEKDWMEAVWGKPTKPSESGEQG